MAGSHQCIYPYRYHRIDFVMRYPLVVSHSSKPTDTPWPSVKATHWSLMLAVSHTHFMQECFNIQA